MSAEPATGLSRRTAAAGSDPRIIVAVITRDRPAGLLRTLDALAALPERPAVIVVDNSRDDSTRRAVRGHPALTRLLRPAENTGASVRLRPRHRRAAVGAAPARPGAARTGTPAGGAGAGPPDLTRPAVCRLNRPGGATRPGRIVASGLARGHSELPGQDAAG
ncbi:glycosyltransferase family 2 protein [Streptomyces puniciscabiei]|uniref:glycosyltransferase family 2 protein n=1 Tax=Streptomyces puniciscabiei TaxID=164348 RepID=UPI003328D428